MFNKVVGYKGFWKSVLVLGLAYAIVLALLFWGMRGFSSEIFTPKFLIATLIAGGVVALGVSYGKFWRKLKEDEFRNS